MSGVFPRAGEGLQSGSEVMFRGVQVGRVSGIALDGTRARVHMLIDPSFRIPTDARATVDPVNLFGAEQVTLTTPVTADGADSDTGPYVAPGGTIDRTASSDELGDLFAAAAPLLDRVNTQNLSAVISDLAQASDGEGPRVARAIGVGAQLAGYLNQTLAAQLAALDSFAGFTASVAPDGPAINGLSAAENAALPTFNADAGDFQHLMDSLTPFANQLAQLLSDYHPDIATLLTDGADVAQVLTAQQDDVGQVIQGAYEYAYKVGNGGSADTLPTGSKFAYFNTFILFTDVNRLVCDLLAPPVPGLSYLEPLQQALSGAGTPLDCQSQLAAFDAAQQAPSAAAATTPAPRRRPPARSRPLRPAPRRPAARWRALPPHCRTRSSASSASRRCRRPAPSAPTSTNCWAARCEAPARPAAVGPEIRRLRAGLPGPAGGAGGQDRQRLAVHLPPAGLRPDGRRHRADPR